MSAKEFGSTWPTLAVELCLVFILAEDAGLVLFDVSHDLVFLDECLDLLFLLHMQETVKGSWE